MMFPALRLPHVAAVAPAQRDAHVRFGWPIVSVLALAGILTLLGSPAHPGITYDRIVLVSLNGAFAAHPAFSALQMMLFNADLAEMVLVVALVALWSIGRVRAIGRTELQRLAILACATFVPTYAVCRAIQHLGHRTRPIVDIPLERFVSPEVWAMMQKGWAGAGSFPSDHAALSALAATIAFSIDRRAGWVLTVFGVYIALVRVAIGYHWPSDVIGGFIVGIAVGCAALLGLPRLRPMLDRVRRSFDERPWMAYPLAVAFLAEFGHGFERVQMLAHEVLHARLFH